MVSVSDNARLHAAFAGGSAGFHSKEFCRDGSLGAIHFMDIELCREGALGDISAFHSMEPRRGGAWGEIWVFFSAAQRDGLAGLWSPLWTITRFAILALSLTNAMGVDSEFTCCKCVMKSASGDDISMVGEM
jgi:hypothetical protein